MDVDKIVPVAMDLLFTESNDRTYRLMIEGQSVYVPKDYLSLLSPVFRVMFYGDYREAKENSAELKEKRLVDVLELLHVLLPVPKYRKSITYENFELLMTFADEFDISQLKLEGEQFLIAQMNRLPIGDESVFKVAIMAGKVWFVNVIEICIPYLCAFSYESFEPFKPQLHVKVIAAVYDAKMKRQTALLHQVIPKEACKYGCFSACRKCHLCANHRSAQCHAFHTDTCQHKTFYDENVTYATKCLCGYTVDENLLA